MKKIFLIALMTLTMSINAAADSHKHTDGTVALPHIMKVIIANKEALKIEEKQQKEFDAIMQQVPPKMQAMMKDTKELEHSIKKDVMHNKKTEADVKASIEKLQTLKYKITELQIKTINKLQTILSNEQYEQLIQIMKSKKKGKNKKSC